MDLTVRWYFPVFKVFSFTMISPASTPASSPGKQAEKYNIPISQMRRWREEMEFTQAHTAKLWDVDQNSALLSLLRTLSITQHAVSWFQQNSWQFAWSPGGPESDGKCGGLNINALGCLTAECGSLWILSTTDLLYRNSFRKTKQWFSDFLMPPGHQRGTDWMGELSKNNSWECLI